MPTRVQDLAQLTFIVPEKRKPHTHGAQKKKIPLRLATPEQVLGRPSAGDRIGELLQANKLLNCLVTMVTAGIWSCLHEYLF